MRRIWLEFALLAALSSVAPAPCAAAQSKFDHVYLIILENHDFEDAFSAERTPFLNRLAQEQGLATQYYGVTHPSLPNYLAMISGDEFGVSDDAPSCFASDLTPVQTCRHFESDTLVDQLESAGLTFSAYFQSSPGAGALQQGFPGAGADALYAQKHNPFMYFDQIAKAPSRLARLKPFDALGADLKSQMANFVFIVPDQCHDGHGLPRCRDEAQLQRDYDAFVATTVGMIRSSGNWTPNSAIVVTFDEGESTHKTEEAAKTENRIPAIVVTQCGAAATNGSRFDHYALLATIEEGFSLPRLRKANGAPTMTDLFRRPCAPPRSNANPAK